MSAAENRIWTESEESRIYGVGREFEADQSLEVWQEHLSQVKGIDLAADDWYVHEYAPGKEQHVKQIHLHFPDTAGQQVKYLLKQYAAWRLGRVRPVTVRVEQNARLSHWVHYLRVRKITDPTVFGVAELERFGRWLRMQGMQEKACERIVRTVNSLIHTGQKLGWQVTKDMLPENLTYWKRIQMELPEKQIDTSAFKHSEWTLENENAGVTRPISRDIYEKILTHALYDETDEITRGGIIIQSQTGLRISEVLSLKENCLKRDGHGRWWLAYNLKKTTKAEPEQRFCPANELVIETVKRLRSATYALRRESGREELFLVRNHGVRQVSQTNWNKGRLQSFLRRWDITDEDGNEYTLHSHQFRATYVRDQMLAGGQIEQVQRWFGHVSSEMTVRYVHLQETEMRTFLAPYMGMMGR